MKFFLPALLAILAISTALLIATSLIDTKDFLINSGLGLLGAVIATFIFNKIKNK